MGDINTKFIATPENLLKLYGMLYKIRRFEDVAIRKFLDREIPGFMHTYQGEEAVAVGVCAALEKEDAVTSTHRGHGHALAKGISSNEVMAELYGKEGGCNGGRGGSMHMYKKSVGFYGTNGMVGGGIGLANGMAYFFKYNRKQNVAVTFFGDGASNMGIFYEALNLAASMKLPVIFICENNLYATSTPLRKIAANSQIASRALAFNMTGVSADGSDVLAVYESVAAARERAIAGQGPTLIEMKTYRFSGHSTGEQVYGFYRSKEEVECWKATKDPVKNFKAQMIAAYGISEDQIKDVEVSIENEIEKAVEYSQNSPLPEPNSVERHIFMEA